MEDKNFFNILKTVEDGRVVYSRLLGKDEKQVDTRLLDDNHKIVKMRSLHGEEMIMYIRIKDGNMQKQA